MLPVDLVFLTIKLFVEHPDADEQEIAELLRGQHVAPTDAVFAVCLVPSACGRLLAQRLGVEVSDSFSLQDRSGAWHTRRFHEHPIGRAAVDAAAALFTQGPRSTLETLIRRSAEVDAVNQALHQGDDVKGARLNSTQVYGVRLEDIETTPE